MYRIWCFALCSCLAFAGFAAPAKVDARQLPADAFVEAPSTATRVPARMHSNAAAKALVSYSGNTTGAPTYVRADECLDAWLAGAYAYQVQAFSVDMPGVYHLRSTQSFDGYIVLYRSAFDPLHPVTNCVLDNDEGPVDNTSAMSVRLDASIQYYFVTTGYNPEAFGTYDNQIEGPGAITLGVSQFADVSVVKSAPEGVASDVPFTYLFTAANAGPHNTTGVTVTDVLPASVGFVSSTCNASMAGNTLTWSPGALPVGDVKSCTIAVDPVGSSCIVVNNTATIASALGDPVRKNNVSTVSNRVGVKDPGFETSIGDGTVWNPASLAFGTPFCDLNCDGAGGNRAHTGAFWIRFGGVAAAAEVSAIQQSLPITQGTTSLTFWVRPVACAAANGADDSLVLTVDGGELWRIDATSPLCGAAGYHQVTVDISAYADGAAHDIAFLGLTAGNGAASTFYLDDVDIDSPPVCNARSVDVSLTLDASPEPAFAGGLLSYASTVTNNGMLDALDVTWMLPMPQGVTFRSMTADDGWDCSPPPVGTNGTVQCEVGLLGSNDSLSLEVVTHLSTDIFQAFDTTATVETSSNEDDTGNNSATATTAIELSAELSVHIDMASPECPTATAWRTRSWSTTRARPMPATRS